MGKNNPTNDENMENNGGPNPANARPIRTTDVATNPTNLEKTQTGANHWPMIIRVFTIYNIGDAGIGA